MVPKRIIFHHSASKRTEPQFLDINTWHKARGFPKSTLGWHVGYHYVIEKDGTVKRARLEEEMGAHDNGENTNSIGICLAGDFTTVQPTEAQARAAAALVADIRTRFKIPITHFEPHRWDDDTECPGKAVSDNWLIEQYLTREANPLHRALWEVGNKLNLL